jgi:hypothetical protein
MGAKFQLLLEQPEVVAGSPIKGTLFFDVPKRLKIKSFLMSMTCMQHAYTLSLGPKELEGEVNQELPAGQFGIPFEFPVPETTFQSRSRPMNGISLKIDYFLECTVQVGGLFSSNLKAKIPVVVMKTPEMSDMEHAYMMMLVEQGKAPWMPRHVSVQAYMKQDPSGPVFTHLGGHSAYAMYQAGLPPMTTYRQIGSGGVHFTASPFVGRHGIF